MSEMQKKLGVTDFVSEIQRWKSTLILKSWAFVTQNDLHSFKFKIFKMTELETNYFSQILSKRICFVNVALKEDIRDCHTDKNECNSMARGQKNRK